MLTQALPGHIHRFAFDMRAALLTPIFTVGVYSGQYLFRIAPADWFKKVTYALLICTALIMLAT